MMSKQAVWDTGQYLLQGGMTHQMLQAGHLVSVREISIDQVLVRQLGGQEMVIVFDIALPSPKMQAMVNRWRKTLFLAAKTCAYVRMLGLDHVSGHTWRATENSVMLPQCNIVTTQELRISEGFAGGYGGWSKAVTYLNQHHPNYPLKIAGALEWDAPTAEMWDMHNASAHGCCCTVGDITSIDVWTDAMNDIHPHILTLSSSCVQFSFAGPQLGWQSREGHALAAALHYAAKSGIEIVLVENVGNLRSCIEFWNGFIAVTEYCNFQIAAEGVVNVQHLHPVNRARELIVLVAKSGRVDQLPHVLISDGCVPGRYPRTLWEMDRWLNPPEEMLRSQHIHDSILPEHKCYDRLPPTMKAQVYVRHPTEVMLSRCVKSNQPLPSGTIMAKYTQQHTLDGDILGSLRRTNQDSARFLHPLEMMVACGISSPCVVPESGTLGYKIVGNCITEMHALVGLVAMINVLHTRFEWNPIDCHRLLAHHASQCIVNQNIKWVQVEGFHAVMHTDGEIAVTGLPMMSPVSKEIEQVIQQDDDDESHDGHGMTCQLSEVDSDGVRPPVVIDVHQQTASEVLEATRALDPSWNPEHLLKQDGTRMMGDEVITESNLQIVGRDAPNVYDRDGVVLSWSECMVMLPILPHQSIAEWNIHGQSLGDFEWFT